MVVKNGAPSGNYTVMVSFQINADSTVSNIKTEQDPGFGMAAEAIRVVQSSPAWTPASMSGKTMKANTKQAITFHIPEN